MRERTGECLLMAGKRKDGSSVCKGVRATQQGPSDRACSVLPAPYGGARGGGGGGCVDSSGSSSPGLPVAYLLGPPRVIAGSLKTLPSAVTCSPAVPDAAATTSLPPVAMETKACEAVVPAGTRSRVLIGSVHPAEWPGESGLSHGACSAEGLGDKEGLLEAGVWGSGRRSPKFTQELTDPEQRTGTRAQGVVGMELAGVFPARKLGSTESSALLPALSCSGANVVLGLRGKCSRGSRVEDQGRRERWRDSGQRRPLGSVPSGVFGDRREVMEAE